MVWPALIKNNRTPGKGRTEALAHHPSSYLLLDRVCIILTNRLIQIGGNITSHPPRLAGQNGRPATDPNADTRDRHRVDCVFLSIDPARVFVNDVTSLGTSAGQGRQKKKCSIVNKGDFLFLITFRYILYPPRNSCFGLCCVAFCAGQFRLCPSPSRTWCSASHRRPPPTNDGDDVGWRKKKETQPTNQ